MSRESRMLAGVLLIVLPTVMFGGISLLKFLTSNEPGYVDNPLRQDLFRAGHAHAGVYLVLSLVMLRYVDEAILGPFWKWLATRCSHRRYSDPGRFLSFSCLTSSKRAEWLNQPCIHRSRLFSVGGIDSRSRIGSCRTGLENLNRRKCNLV